MCGGVGGESGRYVAHFDFGWGLAASVALLYRCSKESGQALNRPTCPSIVFLGVKLGHTWARR